MFTIDAQPSTFWESLGSSKKTFNLLKCSLSLYHCNIMHMSGFLDVIISFYSRS